MSFLLKIVQGPNAGAEIALVVGSTVSFGRGEECDIILTDSALEDKAFDLEVTNERVMMLFPSGKQARMEPFHVRTVGTTSLVMGPAEGAWRDIVWEKRGTAEPAAAHADDEANAADEKADVAESEVKEKKGCLSKFILLLFLLLLLTMIGCVVAWYFFPDKVSQITGGRSDKAVAVCSPYFKKCYTVVSGWLKSEEAKRAEKEALVPAETLADIVGEYNLQTNSTASGGVQIKGDFKTRVDRLRATARIYRVQPGAELDFADKESLTVAIENLLALVTENRMKLTSLEGRTAKLSGVVSSEQDLRRTLEALSRDVPKLVRADCSGVSALGISGPVKESPAKKSVEAKAPSQPVLPIVGILTLPYPCLVLQNGSRIMEGARFGGWTVTKIAPDSVELMGPTGKFTWRP